MSNLGVSVVICCHNAAKRLPATLHHLAAQTGTESIPWEIVVVDNGSSDATAEICRQSWPPNSVAPIRIVSEPRLGLSIARHRGLRESQYEYLSLIDDDNWVAPDWILRVYHLFSARPEVGAGGGCGEPVFDVPPPSWFGLFASAYALGPQCSQTGYVPDHRAFLYGAGMSIRRSAWEQLLGNGFRSILTDRRGRTLSAGGDSELCHALVLGGWKLWYDSDLVFRHYIPSSRLDWNYLRHVHRGFGAAATWLELYKRFMFPNTGGPFRRLGIPPGIANAIRQTWLFQVYATARTLWTKDTDMLWRCSDPTLEGKAEVLRLEWELGRALGLLKAVISYDRTYAYLRNAKWRAQK